jgi:hypothetical protein
MLSMHMVATRAMFVTGNGIRTSIVVPLIEAAVVQGRADVTLAACIGTPVLLP